MQNWLALQVLAPQANGPSAGGTPPLPLVPPLAPAPPPPAAPPPPDELELSLPHAVSAIARRNGSPRVMEGV